MNMTTIPTDKVDMAMIWDHETRELLEDVRKFLSYYAYDGMGRNPPNQITEAQKLIVRIGTALDAEQEEDHV